MSSSTAISVVVPTYNGRALLAKHLPKVRACLQPGDEVIVVDDASTDDTVAWIESEQRDWKQHKIALRVITHETNLRFAAAVNTGVLAAENNLVLLLNNDVHPLSKNARSQLMAWFADPSLFAVGCAEVTSEAAGAKLYGRGTGGWRRGMFVHWFDRNQKQHETLWTAGGSMMLDRSKFLELGGMDTLFRPAYEEDRDLSYQALKRGWKLLFDYDTIVLHQHESTNASVFGQRRMEVMSWKNQYLIIWKNISDPMMILEHILWLPYHLIIGGSRTHWASVYGFSRALGQVLECWHSRQRARKLWKLRDRDILPANAS